MKWGERKEKETADLKSTIKSEYRSASEFKNHLESNGYTCKEMDPEWTETATFVKGNNWFTVHCTEDAKGRIKTGDISCESDEELSS